MNYHLILLAIATLLSPAVAQLPVATTSSMEVVPRVGGSTDYGVRSSMKINPVTGHPGIAHFDRAAGKLIYTAWNGAAWEELVVSTFTRQAGADNFYCSLAYDAAGVPNIAFLDREQDDLKFARLNATGTGFTSVLIDQVNGQFGTVGRYCALAFAPDGKAYLSYYHNEYEYLTQGSDEITTITSELRVATRSAAGVWSLATVDSGGDVGHYTSIALDRNGRPAVAYIDLTRHKAKVAYFNDVIWRKADISTSPSVAFTSIAITAVGNQFDLNVAYQVEGTGQMYLGTLRADNDGPTTTHALGGGIATNIIDHSFSCSDPSLVIDRNGKLLATYFDQTNGDLKIAHSFPNIKRSTIDTTGIVGVWSSLVIGSDGMASVCYRDATAGTLKYAKLTGWATQAVDTVGDVGLTASLAFSPDGRPAISYYDATSDDQKFAERDAYGTWSVIPVDTGETVGYLGSLAFGPNGRPAISYHDSTNGDLKYAERLANGSWSILPIDSDGDVGFSSFLSFGPDGRPAISYRDDTNNDLKFAERLANGTWSVLPPIDSIGNVGYHTSMAFGPGGRPSISYYDETNEDLKYTERLANGAWSVLPPIDTGGDVGNGSAIAFAPDGRPVIGYYDSTNGDLKFAERLANGTWSILPPIDTIGNVGHSISIAFGPDGCPSISYFDYTNSDLKYAERLANGAWSVLPPIDSSGNVGRFTSMAFGPDGRPGISYYDETNGDLKYAERFLAPNSTEPVAPFRVLSFTRDPLTKITTLGWLGTPGGKYRVDFSSTLAADSWQPIGDNLNALDGMTFFRTSTLLGQSNPRAFFRVLRK